MARSGSGAGAPGGSDAADAAAPRKSRRLVWVLLWSLAGLPVAIHMVVFGREVLRVSRAAFTTMDFAIEAAILVYLLLGIMAFRTVRRASKFLLVTYAILLALCGVEGFLAWRERTDVGGPVPRIPLRLVGEVGDAMPGVTGRYTFSVNRLGLRGPEVRLDEMDLTILCIGASSTEGLYITDEKSWPWRLQDILAERLDKRVFVGNAGRSGHIVLNHEFVLRHYELAGTFDWVVILAGVNDMGTMLRRTYASHRREVPSSSLVGLGRFYYRRLRLTRRVQELLGRWMPAAGGMYQDLSGSWYVDARKKRQRLLAMNTIREVPGDLEKSLAQYRRDLKRTIRLCQSRKQHVLLLTHPSMWREGLTEKQAALLWQHVEDGAYDPGTLGEMIGAYNRTLLEVCQETGAASLDLASKLPKDETALYDDCHFNVAGSEMVARLLAECLIHRLRSDGRDRPRE